MRSGSKMKCLIDRSRRNFRSARLYVAIATALRRKRQRSANMTEANSVESKFYDEIVVSVGSNFCSLLLEPTPTLKIS